MGEGRLLAFSRGSTDAGSVAAAARKAADADDRGKRDGGGTAVSFQSWLHRRRVGGGRSSQGGGCGRQRETGVVEGRLLAFSRGSTDAGSVAAAARKAADADQREKGWGRDGCWLSVVAPPTQGRWRPQLAGQPTRSLGGSMCIAIEGEGLAGRLWGRGRILYDSWA